MLLQSSNWNEKREFFILRFLGIVQQASTPSEKLQLPHRFKHFRDASAGNFGILRVLLW